MNVRKYIQSGILDEYCLGLLNAEEQSSVIQLCKLFPEIKQEVHSIEVALEVLAAKQAIAPTADVKQRILNSLGFPYSAIKLDLNNLPDTDRYSNHRSWLNSLQTLIPEKPVEDFFCHVLRQDEKISQMLIITNNDVPPETHEHIKESFFILKGSCKCMIAANIFMLGPGDFLEIPLCKEHTIKMLSPQVTAILQHQYA